MRSPSLLGLSSAMEFEANNHAAEAVVATVEVVCKKSRRLVGMRMLRRNGQNSAAWVCLNDHRVGISLASLLEKP